VRFQLLRLAALLASDDVVALRERALALRAGLPQGIEPSRGLPLWLIEAATLRLRASEGDTASARESAERALALAARANDSRQLAACAIVVQRLCEQAQIAATGLAGYPDALAAVQGIKGAALREHFARQFVQVDVERN
jgi:hypothetical protein